MVRSIKFFSSIFLCSQSQNFLLKFVLIAIIFDLFRWTYEYCYRVIFHYLCIVENREIHSGTLAAETSGLKGLSISNPDQRAYTECAVYHPSTFFLFRCVQLCTGTSFEKEERPIFLCIKTLMMIFPNSKSVDFSKRLFNRSLLLDDLAAKSTTVSISDIMV